MVNCSTCRCILPGGTLDQRSAPCGCALAAVGGPCVAQRVCATPAWHSNTAPRSTCGAGRRGRQGSDGAVGASQLSTAQRHARRAVPHPRTRAASVVCIASLLLTRRSPAPTAPPGLACPKKERVFAQPRPAAPANLQVLQLPVCLCLQIRNLAARLDHQRGRACAQGGRRRRPRQPAVTIAGMPCTAFGLHAAGGRRQCAGLRRFRSEHRDT